jgi:hypothetical protein
MRRHLGVRSPVSPDLANSCGPGRGCGSIGATRRVLLVLCENQADVAAAYRFDPIVHKESASTRLLLFGEMRDA